MKRHIHLLSILMLLLVGIYLTACEPYTSSTEIQSTKLQPSAATEAARQYKVDQECARYPERCVDFSATFTANETDIHRDYPDESNSPNLSQDGCPTGCTFHPDGCNIKGNISFDTKEKIYHIPGGEYYSATTINSSYGERWFCTESEAIANGWRKSYK